MFFSDGIDEGIQWLVESIQRNIEVRPPKNAEDYWNCDWTLVSETLKLLYKYYLLIYLHMFSIAIYVFEYILLINYITFTVALCYKKCF